MKQRKPGILLKEVALFGILGALTFAMKVVMSALPNIEPVSLMIMLFSVTFGRKALYPIYVYIALEFVWYGIHLWSVNYLYIWLILWAAAWLLRKMKSPIGWGILSGCFGLLFGLLCTPVYFFTGGLEFAVSWWVSGIPYDLLHCVGNFVIALVLFVPLRNLFSRLYGRLIAS